MDRGGWDVLEPDGEVVVVFGVVRGGDTRVAEGEVDEGEGGEGVGEGAESVAQS